MTLNSIPPYIFSENLAAISLSYTNISHISTNAFYNMSNSLLIIQHTIIDLIDKDVIVNSAFRGYMFKYIKIRRILTGKGKFLILYSQKL